MSDQHIEIITLHAYWQQAVSLNKDSYVTLIKTNLNRLNPLISGGNKNVTHTKYLAAI